MKKRNGAASVFNSAWSAAASVLLFNGRARTSGIDNNEITL